MASTSEKGHAKNIANANLLNNYILELGTKYNPSNPQLLLKNLQNTYANSFMEQGNVSRLVAPYATAVTNREIIFKPLSKKITKLRKAYKATAGVTQPQLEDFMTVARRLKGIKKVNNVPTTDTNLEKTQHSSSQMSYDQRTNNMDALLALLENTPNYSPNETEYQVATLQTQKDQMLEATQAVANTFIPLNTARSNRNNTMYLAQDNMVDTFNRAKDYLFTILDASSVQYKAISKIKFKKA
jgi:hypothetical protein